MKKIKFSNWKKPLLCTIFIVLSGLSYSYAAENYTRNVLFEISRQQMNEAEGQDGRNYFYVISPKPEHEQLAFGADADENFYVLFRNFVRVFDKAGKFLKKIPLGNLAFKRGNSILVNDDGSFFIFDKYDPYGNGYVYDGVGTLLKHLAMDQKFENPVFNHGIIYSNHSGKIYFSINGKSDLAQKSFLTDFGTGYLKNGLSIFKKDNKGKPLPNHINGYQVHYIQSIDSVGAIYVVASKNAGESTDEYGNEINIRDYVLCKFDSELNFLTMIDIGPRNLNCYIDVATGNIFDVEISRGSYKFVVWNKSN